MTRLDSTSSPARTGRIELRVRYPECDPMGVAHHTAFPVWFEMGRTELLAAAAGTRYRELEQRGIFFAVAKLAVQYRRPVRYDDVLEVTTRLVLLGHAKIEHEYELKRDGTLLATGQTTIVCLDREGRPRAIPEDLGID